MLRRWRQMVPNDELEAVLDARPRPLVARHETASLPSISAANAQLYPPPNLQHFHPLERGPGSAPYEWFTQMMGFEWDVVQDENRANELTKPDYDEAMQAQKEK